MSKGGFEDLKLHSTRHGQLPEPLASYLREQGEDEASVVVEGADGWRHGSADVDLTDPEVQQASRIFRDKTLARIGGGKLSAGEKIFLAHNSDADKDLLG